MYNNINMKIMDLKEKIREAQKASSMLHAVKESLKEEKDKLFELQSILQKEETDVKKLESMTLTALFHTILGSREKQMDKERQEFLAAKLKYDHCRDNVESLESQVLYLTAKVSSRKGLEYELDELLKEKEIMMLRYNDENSKKLNELTEKLTEVTTDIKELKEAIGAGLSAKNAIGKIIESLESAKNWGAWDMMGGGFIATAAKHSKIDNAKEYASKAQILLKNFQRELNDVDVRTSINVNIGGFDKFADYFFDGLIADWVVQSKINSSLEDTKAVYRKVDRIVESLEAKLKYAESQKSGVKYEIDNIIEKA